MDQDQVKRSVYYVVKGHRTKYAPTRFAINEDYRKVTVVFTTRFVTQLWVNIEKYGVILTLLVNLSV